jgi:hypothetical protein
MKIFRLTIIVVGFSLLLVSVYANELILRHSIEDPKIIELITGVSEKVAEQSVEIAQNLIGKWIIFPVVPKTFITNPDVIWQSVSFNTNGEIEITYKMRNSSEIHRFVGKYKVIHKATGGNGNPPSVMVSSKENNDAKVNVLVNLRIGEFSCFPPDVPVLWFQDADGYHYVFEPAVLSAEQRVKLLGRSSTEQKHIVSASSETHDGELERAVNNSLLQQICERLTKLNLTEIERNKEIIRLMKVGDKTCVPVLIDHLKRDNPIVIRQNAVRALGKIGDRSAISPLLEILREPVQGNIDDDDEEEAILRREVVIALEEIGDPAALPVLKSIVEAKREYQSVRKLARIAIQKLAEK